MNPQEQTAALHARASEALDAVATTLLGPPPALAPVWRELSSCVVTGLGASEGPARILARALTELAHLPSRFVPCSSFGAPRPPQGEGLVVVSQGLSPNARIALNRHAEYRHSVLVSSADSQTAQGLWPGLHVVTHLPRAEPGLVLRLVGPAAATAMVLRIAETVGRMRENGYRAHPDFEGLAHAVREAHAVGLAEGATAHFRGDLGSMALLAAPGFEEAAFALANKWVEGPSDCAPAVWDILGWGHGPFQHAESRRMTIVSCAFRGDDFSRRVLDCALAERGPNHSWTTLFSHYPPPYGALELDAAFNGLVLQRLDFAPRDLATSRIRELTSYHWTRPGG